jgi:hypothetical protein
MWANEDKSNEVYSTTNPPDRKLLPARIDSRDPKFNSYHLALIIRTASSTTNAKFTSFTYEE